MSANEHPIFVRHNGEHLAAVVTVPDEPPRGIVMLIQGLGSPRSHRYGLWTRTARCLAERGLATIRFDYPMMGDSTGTYVPHIDRPPIDEARTVLQTVSEAIDVHQFAVVGNCLGGRAAFGLARDSSECVGAISLGFPSGLLKGEGRSAPHRVARRVGKKHKKAAQYARRVLPARRIKARLRFVAEAAETIRTCNTFFLLLGNAKPDHIDQELAAITAHSRASSEVRLLPARGSRVLQLPLDDQQEVIDILVDWLDRAFSTAGGARSTPASQSPTP